MKNKKFKQKSLNYIFILFINKYYIYKLNFNLL